jgi:hypothetical protein
LVFSWEFQALYWLDEVISMSIRVKHCKALVKMFFRIGGFEAKERISRILIFQYLIIFHFSIQIGFCSKDFDTKLV